MTTETRTAQDVSAKAAQILEAAGRLFLEHGYGAVSMDTIARTANVSKATLYAHFRSKDELFAAIVAAECCRNEVDMAPTVLDRMDIGEALTAYGRRFLALLVSPKGIAGHRVVTGECQRFPELARAFYDAGPARTLEALTALLAEADRRGLLSVPDPRMAADQFSGMLKAHLHLRILLGLQDTAEPEEMERCVEGAVGLILRGYAA